MGSLGITGICEALPRTEQLAKLISFCLGREQILDTGLRLGEILDARYTKREFPRRMEWRAGSEGLQAIYL